MAIQFDKETKGLVRTSTTFVDTLAGTDVREEIFRSYGFNGSLDLVTPEIRARQAPYADPVTLNFKWMIDWKKSYGLFADESNINSALAYLDRIGEKERYEMLKIFISKFQEFIRDYDFLILNCEGLAEIVNRKPYEFPKEDEDKVSFIVRETVDLRIQALLTLYRQIWFDDIRCVEVLPANLRRFDCYILVYSAGYYNMALYDVTKPYESYESVKETEREKLLFPTLKKLTKMNEEDISNLPFNHSLIEIHDASFVNEESGKNFFSELSNEMNGDFVKNNITITYRFSYYSGIFHNVTGSFNFSSMLSMLSSYGAIYNKQKVTIKQQITKESIKNGIKNAATNSWNNFKKKTVEAAIQTGIDTVYKLKEDAMRLGGAITATAKNAINKTPIGNAIYLYNNPDKLIGTLTGVAFNAIDTAQQKLIYDNLEKLNRMMMGNFPDNLTLDIPQEKRPSNIEYQENIKPLDTVTEKIKNKSKMVSERNIYKRNTF